VTLVERDFWVCGASVTLATASSQSTSSTFGMGFGGGSPTKLMMQKPSEARAYGISDTDILYKCKVGTVTKNGGRDSLYDFRACKYCRFLFSPESFWPLRFYRIPKILPKVYLSNPTDLPSGFSVPSKNVAAISSLLLQISATLSSIVFWT